MFNLQKPIPQNLYHSISIPFTEKNERKFLKAFLLGRFQYLLYELFQNELNFHQTDTAMESYTMDRKILQLIIQKIIETGEYTLEGIAFYTHIPFDVIYDAAHGINKEFSITPWARVIDLLIQVKPEVEELLIKKLLESKDKNRAYISSLLKEA